MQKHQKLLSKCPEKKKKKASVTTIFHGKPINKFSTKMLYHKPEKSDATLQWQEFRSSLMRKINQFKI